MRLSVAILSALLTIVVSTSLEAQIRKIPATVTDAFKAKYPSATGVEWKDRLTGFIAAFDQNGVHYEARFSNKAEWQSTENEITKDDLPAAVNDGFQKSKYADDWKMNEAYKIAIPGDKIQYLVHIQKGNIQKKILLFNSEGRLLKEGITL